MFYLKSISTTSSMNWELTIIKLEVVIAKSVVVIYNLFLLLLVNENLTLRYEKNPLKGSLLMNIQDYTKDLVDE